MRKTLHILALISLTALVAFHAYTMDITNDEAYSFFLLKTEYYRALFGTANTHWLNSFFMQIEMLVLGDSVLGLRLHSVVAFPFFCVGVYRLTGFIRNNSLAIFCYLLILFNPYVLDWFALARGYALAMTFQVWVVYCLLFMSINDSLSIKKWSVVFVLMGLMLLSNWSYLYTTFGVGAVFLLALIRKQEGYGFNTNTLKIFVGFVMLILPAAANLWWIKQEGDLWHGGTHIVNSMFATVWERYIYHADYGNLDVILAWVSFVGICAAMAYFGIYFLKKRQLTSGVFLAVILSVLLLLNVFFHLVFGTPYLATRTALQWWTPGLVLIFLFLDNVRTDDFSRRRAPSQLTAKVVSTGTLLISISLVVHLITQFDPHHSHEWSGQQYSKQIVNDLDEFDAKNVGLNKYVIGVFSNYYRLTDERFFDLKYSLLAEKKLANCTDKKWETINDLDYIIVSSDETMTCLKRKNIAHEIVKQYDNHRVIRLIH